jgi:hypothetical protein
MTRFVNPVPQFFDDAGNVLAGGKLFFYDTGTTTLKNTYSDSDLSKLNKNPVILDGEGRVATGDGEIFLSGNYKVRLTDSSDVQLWERDPVSSVDDLTREWTNGSTYNKDQIVIGSDTLFYISLTDNNTGNDPTTDDGSNWTRIQFLQDWAKGKTYATGEWVVGSDNILYIAKVGSLNIDPIAGDTDTWFIYRGGPVLQPTNVSPVDTAISVPIFPTLTGDSFSIAQGADDHILSNWQIASDDAFSSIVYDSAFDKDRESHTLTTALATATEYHFRVKYCGAVTGASEFSDGTSFTTQVGPANQFSIDLWTGNGSIQSINNAINFDIANGLVWIKSTSKVADNNLVDTLSGSQKYLVTNNDGSESTDLNKLTSFDSNGYTIAASTEVNENTEDYVGFTFVQRSGFFDIVKYTGNIDPTQKINHFLGSSIGFMVVKANGATNNWIVKTFDTPISDILKLNTDDAYSTPASLPLSLLTPTNFTVGFSGADGLNTDGVGYTAYLFAQNAGNGVISGTYTGTGAALKITTGFDTQLVLVKNTTNSSNWVMLDSVRSALNPALDQLNPNLQDAESALASGVDFLTDGFELQGAELELNAVGDDYIYLAIADPTTL